MHLRVAECSDKSVQMVIRYLISYSKASESDLTPIRLITSGAAGSQLGAPNILHWMAKIVYKGTKLEQNIKKYEKAAISSLQRRLLLLGPGETSQSL